MEISFSTMFFHDHPLPLIFDVVEMAGADTLEFWPETPDWWLSGLPADILENLVVTHPFHAPLSVHAPVLDLNPCSINPDVVEVSISWISFSIMLAESLGAGVCTIHPGRRTSKRPPTPTDLRRLNHMLDSIAPIAERSKVAVSIENMEPKINALLSTPGEIYSLLADREWLSFTLDTCHVSMQGTKVLEDFIAKADGRISNVHFSGAEGDLMHMPVYDNSWAEQSIQVLTDSGYEGLITLEINDLSIDLPMTADEKITCLSRDVSLLKEWFS